jgi:hypothetical protein
VRTISDIAWTRILADDTNLLSEKQNLQQFFTDFKEIFKESLQYFFVVRHSQLLEMPQITCLIIINTNTNFEICSVLMPKALDLTPRQG